MKKTAYILAILVLKTFVSCDKKMTTPSPVPKPPITQDTLSGKIYTIAGNGYDSAGNGGYSGDGGLATKAKLWSPDGVTADASGNLYISDSYNERVRKVSPQGIITTIAGNGKAGYSGDGGPATGAELKIPEGLAVDAAGNLYIVDYDNNCIRKVNTSGVISTFAGYLGNPANGGYSGDGGPATNAELNGPNGIALDGTGNLYIADYGNDRIRKVNTNGIITTVAGGGVDNPDSGGAATLAELRGPYGVAVDASGNIYIASINGNCIFKVNTNGIISTIAGTGNGWYAGDGGPAVDAQLNNPTDVVIDNQGNIYIADADNYRIRMVNTAGIISTYAGNGDGGDFGDGGLATNAGIAYILSIALDGKGNLYIADLYFNRIRIVYK